MTTGELEETGKFRVPCGQTVRYFANEVVHCGDKIFADSKPELHPWCTEILRLRNIVSALKVCLRVCHVDEETITGIMEGAGGEDE